MNTDLQTDPREDYLPSYIEQEPVQEVVSEGPVLAQLTPDDQPVRGIDGHHFNPLRTVTSWERTATGIRANVDDSVLTLDIVDSDVFRVQILPEWMKEAAPSYAIIRDPSTWAAEFTLQETESEIRLQTFDARIFIAKSPFRIEAYRPDGSPILECPMDNGLGSYSRLNRRIHRDPQAEFHEFCSGTWSENGEHGPERTKPDSVEYGRPKPSES